MSVDETADGIPFLDSGVPEGCEFRPVCGTLSPAELDWIGRELRESYKDVLREPVPDRLLAPADPGLARRRFH